MEKGISTAIHGLDIETDTSIDGLDPRIARITAVAVASAEGDRVFDDSDEALLLDRLDWHLASIEPGVLVTWNGARFDLPFLHERARRNGVRLGLRMVLDPALPQRSEPLPGHEGAYRASWHAHAHLDLYPLYRDDPSTPGDHPGSLKHVAAAYGLEPVRVDRSKMHQLDSDDLSAYVASDARCTRLLALRRWPGAVVAIDRMPPTYPGGLPGGVTRAVLRARALRGRPMSVPSRGARAVPAEAVR